MILPRKNRQIKIHADIISYSTGEQYEIPECKRFLL